MMLYDFRGETIPSSDLLTEQAFGGVSHVRNPFDDDVVVGLTPETLGNILRRAKNGDQNDYLAMVAEMERRDSHYFSVLQTRKLAVRQLEIFVDEPPKGDDTKAVELIRSVVTSAKFRGALLHVLDGISKGYSVIEVMWQKGEVWKPEEYVWRNPRWFEFDRETGTKLHLYDGTPDGVPLIPNKYITHQPVITSGLNMAGGLGRIVSVLHLFKGYAMKDWMTFAEVFGLPLRIGKYPHSATKKQKEALKEAVTAIGSDAAAIIPDTMKIEFERASATSASADEFFMILCNWLNKETSKAVLGQTMTTEDGSSLAQAKVHENVRNDIRNADARAIEDTINRDLIKPIIDFNFGVRPNESDYPKFGLDTTEDEDLELWLKALPLLVQFGVEIPIVFVANLFGIPEAKVGQTILEMSSQPQQPQEVPPPTDEVQALFNRIVAVADRHTNMRSFKRELKLSFINP